MAATATLPTSTVKAIEAKPHFAVLDGLRGVAAIGVVTFHFMEMVTWNYSKLWIGHGFLAVDFFFCLSGFVMGYAYDDRIAGMGVGRFLKARLIRLHPLVVLGTVLGLIAFYANPFGVIPGYGPGKVTLMFAASLLMIPYGVMKERVYNLVQSECSILVAVLGIRGKPSIWSNTVSDQAWLSRFVDCDRGCAVVLGWPSGRQFLRWMERAKLLGRRSANRILLYGRAVGL